VSKHNHHDLRPSGLPPASHMNFNHFKNVEKKGLKNKMRYSSTNNDKFKITEGTIYVSRPLLSLSRRERGV